MLVPKLVLNVFIPLLVFALVPDFHPEPKRQRMIRTRGNRIKTIFKYSGNTHMRYWRALFALEKLWAKLNKLHRITNSFWFKRARKEIGK
jgi:hypothetical protein